MESQDDDDDDDDVLFSLTNFGASSDGLETRIAKALELSADQVTIVEADDDRVLFVVYNNGHDKKSTLDTLNNNNNDWNCSVAEMEEEVEIDEEEAFQLWKNMNQESRTCHLKAVLSPDGELIQPQHDLEEGAMMNVGTAVQQQLKRDPHLWELDNVPRIETLQEANWDEPFILTTTSPTSSVDGDHVSTTTTRDHLLGTFGDIQVRTGNRNTLVESGFDNSLPLTLSEAFARGSIVFTPVQELPQPFQIELAPLLAKFPRFPSGGDNAHASSNEQKYTLCLANQAGFGIGMHKHSAAFFYLLQGKKKWYMAASSSSGVVTDPTHPGFYTTKSTHKCVQAAGEILYVPDQWYHEIFNLDYTAGIQSLPNE